jgi:hypothetical protein
MFRFTIRELALLTLVVGLGVGWWIDRSRLAKTAAKWEAKAVFVANAMLGTEYEVGKPWELEPRLKFRGSIPIDSLSRQVGSRDEN